MFQFLFILSMIIFYVSIATYLYFQFKENDYSIKKTFDSILKDFNIKNCCFKNIEKAEEKGINTSEIKKTLKEEDIDCKKPYGLPFNICFDGKMSEKDIELRKKLLDILKARDNVVFDGGKEKLVVPLEATLFLTKETNPLVNERGEIQIISKYEKIHEQIKELEYVLKDSGNFVYKDDKELIENLINIAKEFNSIKSENINHSKDINKSDNNGFISSNVKVHVPIKTTSNINKTEEEQIIDKKSTQKTQEDFKEDIAKPINKQENISSQKEIESQDKNTQKKENIENKSKQNIINTNDKKEEKNNIQEDIKENPNIIIEEKEVLEDEKFNTEQKSNFNKTKEFYKNIEFKTVKTQKFDFENIPNFMSRFFGEGFSKNVFANNLLKTSPLIFNNNKTKVFIDEFNIYFAIAKMFINSEEMIQQFNNLSSEQRQEFIETFCYMFEEEVDEKEYFYKKYFKHEKNEQCYYGFGIEIDVNFFKQTLKKSFDYFLSFPYNSFKDSDDCNKDGIPRIVSNIKNAELKID